MAARNQPAAGRSWTPEKARLRIKATVITKHLTDHVVGKREMTASQVSAGLGLLKKVLPDLQAIDATVKGDPNHPIMITATDGRL